MLATCPRCSTEAEFIGLADPRSMRAREQAMFSLLQPVTKRIDEIAAGIRNSHVLECTGCNRPSNRCATCETLFIGVESDTRCPACQSNRTANG